MGRQAAIARSIVLAILWGGDISHKNKSLFARFLQALADFFTLWSLRLVTWRGDLFRRSRGQSWGVGEDEYKGSFSGEGEEKGEEKEMGLRAMGDMGYSGSTFFTTRDTKYLIKSVPRGFEHTFFRDDLLEPYVQHMAHHPDSLLIRITDFLACDHLSLGGLLGIAPTHHIVMENLLYGQPTSPSEDQDSDLEERGNSEEDSHSNSDSNSQAWRTWDLKPPTYFYPERDVAGGALASEATKSKLADTFAPNKIVLERDVAAHFWHVLEADTRVLERANAVDYSLFLVRIPVPCDDASSSTSTPVDDASASASISTPASAAPAPPSWRTGVRSADGRYEYRAAVLDFFWAKHKLRARAMTGLINSYRVVDEQGPMSITTSAEEYRERFLGLCREVVEVREEI